MSAPTLPRLPVSLAARAPLAGLALVRGDAALQRIAMRATWANALAFLAVLAAFVVGVWTATGALIHGDVLRWFVRVTLLLAAWFVVPVLASIVSAILLPVYRSRVFARARALSGGAGEGASGLGEEVHIATVEVRRAIRLLAWTVALLPLNLIPVVGNVAYLAGEVLVASHTLGWDLVSYHFERNGVRYPEQKRWLRHNRVAVLALGAMGALLCLVPLAQFYFVFTNVAGAGWLSAELDKRVTPP